jgi:molybdopterin-guanine dinucleotide biosynthesis protein A
MGRDKALLEIGGRAMALRVADALRAGGCDPVVIVGDVEGLSSLGLPVLPDPAGLGRHPLAGVVAACTLGPRVLTAPCDLPDLHGEDVAALLAAAGPAEATVDGRRQPLLGVVDAASADALRDAATQGAPARRALEGRLPVPLPRRAARNINTPAELAMLWAGAEDEHGER